MSEFNRRTFLKSVGGTGVALTVAGCMGGGDGDGDGSTTTGTTASGDTTTTADVTTLTPGTASGFPPFEYVNESGDLVGFDVDLLSAVVEQTDGYELGSWEDLAFDQLIVALDNGNIDVAAAAMTINPDRDETIDFTDPYYDANQAVLVREGGSFRPENKEDLADRPIGAQAGTTGKDQMDSLVEDGTISSSQTNTYENYVLAVQDLANGNIDAVIVDTPVAETFVANRNVVVSFTIETGEQYGFGVRENASDLQSALNEGLQAVRDDGTYADLTEQYFASE
ncbi:ABC-type transport system periplasmic substrate-binding protein (probable substrate glutamine/glutamate/polar amino acids) [Halobacterium hubeiense]|uniref:ABC-type transport system periplasmic substrate-binding protein (Probable substrate glutamine/glutamate/polar amino acids) n=1 Tax=Halobacterium hubeiense TaxID=1407499 RepID=A0A0U5H4S6_9EURY|nr:transporter substrate-binding domain-containing protein [Halobacterium hubeiense]CQH59350.1 ABC-type transport system periplasmic substrate-binding protein (probable substrate glutamine/glutamate/polar amino acids) [Halobacterium hubeiense]